VLLSSSWAGWKSRARHLIPLASAALLANALVEVRGRALELESRLEPPQHAPLAGRYLTFRLSDVGLGRLSWNHGDFDSARSMYTYVLSAKSLTPYLFAFAHYLPIWFDSAKFIQGTRPPREWDANEGHTYTTEAEADAYDLRQIRNAVRYQGYDGLIAFGSARRVAHLLAQFPASGLDAAPIAPGVLLFKPISPGRGGDT
jgi:hypothetical protein